MAVAIEFVNVIICKAAAEKKYPGGLDALAHLDLANYLEDEHLVRVGFMSSREAFGFVNELAAAGLHYSDEGGCDLAVIPWTNGATPPWLSVGECEGRGACWMGRYPRGKLVDLDPYMMLRIPARALTSIEGIVRILRQGGADVQERVPNTAETATVLLDCAREGAWIEVEVFKDSDTGRPIGVWGRRNLGRRTTIPADQALMRDLATALIHAGAEDPSEPR